MSERAQTPPLGEDPKIWYVAECHDCEPVLPQPFSSARERAHWMIEHRDATGHHVTLRDEPRKRASR